MGARSGGSTETGRCVLTAVSAGHQNCSWQEIRVAVSSKALWRTVVREIRVNVDRDIYAVRPQEDPGQVAVANKAPRLHRRRNLV